MLLEVHLRSMPPNTSSTSALVWEEFKFDLCTDFGEVQYIWTSFTLLCFAIGFPASLAILLEMFKTHRRGTPFTPNDFFKVNLTVMDVVFLAFIPPGLLNHFILKNWVVEAIWHSIFALSTCGRPMLMACICLDCYLAVVHPIYYHKRKSLTPRVVMVVIVWICTIVSGIVYCLFYKLYFTLFSIMPYITAIGIIGICDCFILHALVKSDPGRKNIHPQKQRAIQTVINSLVIAVLSYLPPVLLLSIGKYLISSFRIFLCTIGVPIIISSASGSAVMPILHLNNHGKLNCFRVGCCRKS